MSMTGQHPGATKPGSGEAAPPLVVVVVGDSRNRTRTLRGLLSAPGFIVAAEVCTALEAEAAVVEHEPGAVLLDLDPASGGIEAIERIMGTRPTPVVVCGAMAQHSQAALAAGFADQSHMNRIFMRQFGFTPGAWQRAMAPRGPAAALQ